MVFLPSPKGLKVSPEHKRVLQSLAIDEYQPGPILHDFEALLLFIKEHELPVTASHQLPMRALSDINARLAHPLELRLKRPQQKSYPHIHGLYLLARASGLTYVDETSDRPVLLADEQACQGWASLNPTERYCTLLESWLLRGKPEIIGERRRPLWLIPENFQEATSFYVRVPDEGLAVAGNRDTENWLMYSPGWHNLGLLDLFGLIRVQHGSPEPGQGWRIKTIHRTPVGDALLAALYSSFFKAVDRIVELEDEGKVPVGILQPALRPYFPGWKNNLSASEWVFRDGTYLFKVSLGPVWRRIAIGAKHSLDDLATTILDSVEFDQDHLYQFSYRNRFGSSQDVNHPFMDEGPYTSEVLVGDVPLRVGQTMAYLFDFGDHWEFDVALEQVDPARTDDRPRILETHGESPEQYPGWEDEDEDMDWGQDD
jgi:hypothetical protein